MTRPGRIVAAFASAATAVAALGLTALSADSSADTCTVTITSRSSGQTLATFSSVNVPAGTSTQSAILDALQAAGLVAPGEFNLGTATVSDSCSPSSATSTTTSSTPTTGTSTSTTTPTTTTSRSTTTTGSTSTTRTTTTRTTTTPTTTTRTTTTPTSTTRTTTTPTTSTTTTTPAHPGQPKSEPPSSPHRRHTTTTPRSASHRNKRTHRRHRAVRTPSAPVTTTPKGPATKTPRHRSAMPGGKGVPSAGNPAFSLTLPGAPAAGVPNFFIESFQIPPFLIPIYQAAGIEYQVPWQVLAGINEIETDYGRNLSVSSAGAVGWMQFMPSTWKRWGVDANGDGVADPYNPVDAIFSAARYLHAAGASSNLNRAIFAYNHAGWYVQSVLLRAKLIGGIPSQLVGSLAGMVQGHFPVAAPARYSDDSVVSLSRHKIKGSNAAIAVDSNPKARGTSIFAKRGSPAIAVNDGKIVKLGHSAALGNYVALQDSTGNIYTYAHLGRISKMFPSPKPVKLTARDIKQEMATPKVTAPTTAASAGAQVQREATSSSATPTAAPASPARAHKSKAHARLQAASAKSQTAPTVKERLFAFPSRRNSYAAGGNLQLKHSGQSITNFNDYFAGTLHLARNQYTLKRLKVGSIVVAGTILGRIGGPSQGVTPHLYFTIQPAGRHAPDIDPKPILDGWKLLQATAVYRANGMNPFYGTGAHNPSTGQVLLMSKAQLTERVLTDPHVRIYNCGRRDIQAGTIDRRVLAVIEYLSASGLDPTVSGLACNHSANGSTGVDSAGATGQSVDISKINGIPIAGHQGPGSITDLAIRRLLTLQGSMTPDEIVSDMSYKGQSRTLALPDHKNRIQVSFTPEYGANAKASRQVSSALKAGQWQKLIARLDKIPEPMVPISPSKYAIRTSQGHQR